MTSSSFLSLAYLQHSLNSNDTDSTNKKLAEIILRANEQVDNDLSPHIDTSILNNNDDSIFPHCRSLALYWAKIVWYTETLLDTKLATQFQEQYDNKLASIIKELKSKRTSRESSVLISSDPRDIRTILPSGIFLID